MPLLAFEDFVIGLAISQYAIKRIDGRQYMAVASGVRPRRPGPNAIRAVQRYSFRFR
jgi:hypothetical protein